MTTTQVMTDTLTLQVRRVIKGSRQRVFDAWTKPELIQKWFGPAALTVADVKSDLRVNGAYRVVMEGQSENCAAPEDSSSATRRPVATGIYTEIVPNERLSFTWRGDWGEMEDTLVTVEFKDALEGTELILTHSKFANQQMLEGHNKGWNESFDKLAGFIQA
jgi:uncharacterized protein YndB with AHSA1/START domain